ncbi:MAG: hypothetical protein RBT71_03390 [Flavobacteriales bacterium]|jgi:hypothetical protein|nr:hypothetical protein [Flavobacteriales bacterium]
MRTIPVALLAATLLACGNGGDLCQATFEPYPDLITGRVISNTNRQLLSGMEAYRTGDFATAVDSLEAYIRTPVFNKAAHLYLANAYLATGRPFDAELHLDHLRNSPQQLYRDEWEWYTVVCWACSDQPDRALEGARKIAEGRKHTYQEQARRLVKRLE